LLVQSLTNHHGFIGRLLGISAINGVAPGETVTVICERGCARHLLRTIPVRSLATALRATQLTHPLLLSATTQIQIDVSATGKLSRYTRFAFSLARSSLAVRVTQTGCLSATGHKVGCRAPT
jgi:3-deoxy-D-manno-octulosonic acid (KDO) 8-phosphate synthase